MAVINAIVPLFLFVGLGQAFWRFRFLPESAFEAMNRLVYYVALPALLFYKTAELQGIGEGLEAFYLSFTAATLMSLVLGYLLAWGFKVPGFSVGAFVQAGFRGNLAFVGLPVVLYYIHSILMRPELEGPILLLLGPMIILYNFLAVLVLSGGKGQGARGALVGTISKVIRNPLILSSLAGLGFFVMGWELPEVLVRTLSGLGQMVLPLSLISVGGALRFSEMQVTSLRQWLPPLIKCGINPLFGWAVASALGLAWEMKVILAIFLVAPTAAAAVILSSQMNQDTPLTANSILLSMVGAFLSMSLILVMALA